MIALTKDLLQNYISLYGEKTVKAIQNLPEEELTWVVYNANMVNATVCLIADLRGTVFATNYVHVVSRECGDGAQGPMYFDPKLFDLIGNGYG